MSVSVIVPALNEEALIGGLMVRLQEQDYRGDLEIIVVDGRSSDQTASIVGQFEDVALVNSIRGVSAQRNSGAKRAHHEFMVFMDADTMPRSDFIRKLVRAYEQQEFSVACPWFVPATRRPDIHAVFGALNTLFLLSQYRYHSGAGVCIATPRTVFAAVGGFDEALHIGEDVDYLRRAAAVGRHRHLLLPLLTSARRFEEEGVAKTTAFYAQISPALMSGDFARLKELEYPPVRRGTQAD